MIFLHRNSEDQNSTEKRDRRTKRRHHRNPQTSRRSATDRGHLTIHAVPAVVSPLVVIELVVLLEPEPLLDLLLGGRAQLAVVDGGGGAHPSGRKRKRGLVGSCALTVDAVGVARLTLVEVVRVGVVEEGGVVDVQGAGVAVRELAVGGHGGRKPDTSAAKK